MPAQLSSLSSAARRLLAGFTTGQKAVTALGLVGVLLAGAVFTGWASKPAMVPLFSGLESADAGAITEELASRGASYELADGGATVLVPQKDVYQLRLDMSAAGLPAGGVSGYALLDEQGITTSEFRQRIDYQRALEGELAKTITAIDGVQAATVHLVMPEQSLFSEDSRQPSASVLVKDEPGSSMAPGQVQAVVNLVAGSVEGLAHEQVTVADATGRVLSTAGEDGLAAGDARASQTTAYEQELQRSVEEMLTPLVGAGGAVVRVKADLDFDRRETVSETYATDPESPVTSEKTGTEDYTGTGAVVGGVLGPENAPAGAGGDSQYTKEAVERSYAVGKTTEQVISAPGAVQRLSVAVVLDAAGGDGITTGAVEQLVVAATGLDRERGDVVEVSQLGFDDTAAEAAEAAFAEIAAAEQSSQRWALLRTGGVLLVVALLVGQAVRVMRRDRRTAVPIPVLELQAAQAGGPLESAGRTALEPAPVDPADARRLTVQAEVGQLVERQPDEVAQLLRGWLADRRS